MWHPIRSGRGIEGEGVVAAFADPFRSAELAGAPSYSANHFLLALLLLRPPSSPGSLVAVLYGGRGDQAQDVKSAPFSGSPHAGRCDWEQGADRHVLRVALRCRGFPLLFCQCEEAILRQRGHKLYHPRLGITHTCGRPYLQRSAWIRGAPLAGSRS